MILSTGCQKSISNRTGNLVSLTISSESGIYTLDKKPDLEFTEVSKVDTPLTIRIDPSIQYQSFLGFGESFDGSTIYNLARMTPAKRTELLEKMIDPENGAGFNLFRICIGTSDFTPEKWGWYSLDDMPDGETDPGLIHFSIQKDIDHHILQVLKEALQIANNHGVKLHLIASPWSPPAWMKDNQPYSMNGGVLQSQYNQVYANYLFRFLEAYKNEGIPIYALTVQNEPGWVTSTPSTNMSVQQEAEIIKYLKSYLVENPEIDTRIYAYDWNFHDITFPQSLLQDEALKQDIAGIAFHAYDWVNHDEKNLTLLHEQYPDVPFFHTERALWNCSGMDQLVKMFRHYLCSYIGWVTLLDKDNADDSGMEDEMFPGIPTAPYFVLQASATDTNVTAYSISPTFYLKQQFSKYIQQGAKRIYSDVGNSTLSNVVFLNPDGMVAMVVVNQSTSARSLRVISQDEQIVTTIPEKTVATFKWKNVNSIISPTVNLAEGKSVAASSSDGTNLESFVNDENIQTRWASLWNDNEWIRIDLGSSQYVNRLVLDWEDAYGLEYLIQVSDDARSWKTVYHEQFGSYGEHSYPVGQETRYLKMQGLRRGTGWGYSLFEFQVY